MKYLERLFWVLVILAGFAWALSGPIGCSHAPKTLSGALNEVIGAATGPCAADLAKAAATCKQQYPGLPW